MTITHVKHIYNYNGIHGSFQNVHGSQEHVCDKCGYTRTQTNMWAVATINVGIAQVHPMQLFKD